MSYSHRLSKNVYLSEENCGHPGRLASSRPETWCPVTVSRPKGLSLQNQECIEVGAGASSFDHNTGLKMPIVVQVRQKETSVQFEIMQEHMHDISADILAIGYSR